jgi:hypothetical protein
MRKIIATNSLDVANKYGSNWTYFLISEDKRFIKIGSTLQPLRKRIIGVNNELNYSDLNFSFYLAVRGIMHEELFHEYFKQYRACFRWTEKDGSYSYLTNKESWKRSLKNTPIKGEHTRKLRTFWYFNSSAMHTRLELFKFPPRKVLPKLESIVLEVIESQGYEISFKE